MRKILILLVLILSVGFIACSDSGSSKDKIYTITFDANEGTGVPTPVEAIYGKPMPAISIIPERTGYDFVGYFDDKTGGTKYYNADLTSAANWGKKENTMLYAQWVLEEGTVAITITYNNNGGTGTMEPQTVLENTEVTLRANTFTRGGHTFEGWATSASGSVVYANEETFPIGVSNIDLYAVWNEIPTYQITFNSNAGDATGEIPPVRVALGAILPTISDVKVRREGLFIVGYFDASTGGKMYYQSYNQNMAYGGDPVLSPVGGGWDKEADTVLYAQWTTTPPYGK